MTTTLDPQALVTEYVSMQDITLNKSVSDRTHQLLTEIASFLKPGISELQMSCLINDYFQESQLVKYWHKPFVRFGKHTTLSYYDVIKNDDLILQENDIAYLDIGPVIEGIEGDAGQTYVIGNNPDYQAIQSCCEKLFLMGLNYWKENNPTGKSLYDFLIATAKQAGYTLDLDPAGHMIGQFPHKGWKKGINHYNYALDPGIWILEIHLLSPCGTFGAFYENILI